MNPKESPCIGRSLAFPDADLYYKWLAGFLLAKHNGILKPPDELTTSGPRRPANAAATVRSSLHPLPHTLVPSAAAAPRAPPAHHPAHIPGTRVLFSPSLMGQLTSIIQTRPESTGSEESTGGGRG